MGKGFLIVMIGWALLALSCSLAPGSDKKTSAGTSATAVGHSAAKLSLIPQSAIESAKSKLHIAYGHTSHGSQLIGGMTGLVTFKGSLYSFNNGGTGGALDLRDTPFSGANDLGNPNYTAWEAATRTYLDANPDINVVIWSWCGQVSGCSETQIDNYLNLMSGLEASYPSVAFVYMTGHLDGTGLSGNLHLRNNQIRAYCSKYNKWLYDFEDIESYDPDGVYYGNKYPTDGCNYDLDNDGNTSQSGDPAEPTGGDTNWASVWQNAHPGEWYSCGSAHTKPLNANQKAYAAWYLWARIAGWSGN